MSVARLIDAGGGRVRLEGALDFTTVTDLLARGEPLLREAESLSIDLAGVETANSAGLALLLEWLDIARARRATLRYVNMPASLTRIAAFSNLRDLLPVTADADS